MIKLITWKWRNPKYRDHYKAEYVNTFYRMAARHITVPYEPLCITDDPTGVEVPTLALWENPAPHYGQLDKPNCFFRLRAFSSDFKKIAERFVWFDLDSVITDNIDHLLTDDAQFRIWKPDGEAMPCNGSLVLHQSGTRPYTWTFFDSGMVDALHGYRYVTGFQGSDQAWIAHNLKPQDKFFTKADGIFSYRSHIDPLRKRVLPPGAKVVFFNGRYKPWDPEVQKKNPWIAEHYK